MVVFVSAHRFSSCSEQGSVCAVVGGLLTVGLLLLGSTGSRCAGFGGCCTWAQQSWCRGLAAPWHVGIFPDQGLNQRPLHCRVDS